MNDIATAILDAAERRMRIGGFGGFSHREIAAEVGVKSSSVHYHFPTKDKLAAAAVRRYTKWTSDLCDRGSATEPDPVKVWSTVFRGRSSRATASALAAPSAPALWIYPQRSRRR